jgi:hypothetical protein
VSKIASSSSERGLSHDVGGRLVVLLSCAVMPLGTSGGLLSRSSRAAECVFNSADLHTPWRSMLEPLAVNGRASCNVPAITSLEQYPCQHIVHLVCRFCGLPLTRIYRRYMIKVYV